MYTQNTQTVNKAIILIIFTSLQVLLQAALSSFILSTTTIMAPVEIEVIPRDVVAAPVAHFKIVDKAFELPLINDTYNEVTRLASPLSPFVVTMKENVEKVTPMLESGFITIKTTAEEKLFPQLPEGTTANIKANLDTAKEKVTSAVDSLDSLACVGLDQLTAKVPALKDATPELIETAKVC
jgi:hypothetical protein